MSGSPARAELVELLARRRYEEALTLLRAARQRTPDVPEIARGIQLLKQRLLRRYLHQLGDLDRVPRRVRGMEVAVDGVELGDEERELIRLVDGVSSFGDLATESRFGRFETYRMLTALLSRGVLSVPDDDGTRADASLPPEPEIDFDEMILEQTPPPVLVSEPVLLADESAVETLRVNPKDWEVTKTEPLNTDSVPPRQSRRAIWVGLLVGVGVVAIAATGIWWFLLGEDPFGSAPVVGAAPPPAEPTAPPEPAPLAATTAPPPANPNPNSNPHPNSNPEPSATPYPSQTLVPTPPPSPTANPSPSPPPNPAPNPAPNPNPNPPPNPNPAPNPPPSPTHPTRVVHRAAQPDAPPAAPTTAPTHEVVEEAIAKIEPALRACYVSVARRLQLPTPPTLQVSLTIDEAGLARDLDTNAGRPSGLVECVRDASGRMRHGEPATPLGAVRVSFTLTLPPPPPAP